MPQFLFLLALLLGIVLIAPYFGVDIIGVYKVSNRSSESSPIESPRSRTREVADTIRNQANAEQSQAESIKQQGSTNEKRNLTEIEDLLK